MYKGPAFYGLRVRILYGTRTRPKPCTSIMPKVGEHLSISVAPLNVRGNYPTSLRPLPSAMAELVRTTKSDSDSTANELATYNITVVKRDSYCSA